MRKDPHVRICGGLGSATTLVYPTLQSAGRVAVLLHQKRLHDGQVHLRCVEARIVTGIGHRDDFDTR